MDEELVSCPYNVLHKFARSKLPFHIQRCKDGKKLQHLFTRCSYNSVHIVKKTQKEDHELICPDKEMHERLKENMDAVSSVRGISQKEE